MWSEHSLIDTVSCGWFGFSAPSTSSGKRLAVLFIADLLEFARLSEGKGGLGGTEMGSSLLPYSSLFLSVTLEKGNQSKEAVGRT
jgi:hypothetical protein